MNRAAFALFVLAFQDPVPETDVVILKDGTARPGFVVEENAEGVVMDVLLKGPKGETAGVARLTVPRKQIASIRRASEEQRARTLERMAAFRSRGRAAAEAVAAIRLEPDRLLDRPAWSTRGRFVAVTSTCSREVVKEVHHALEQAFGAYSGHFGVKGDLGRRIPVYLLADAEEYVRWQRARFGDAVLHPAFFHATENIIAAFNGVQRDLEAELRAGILGYEEQMRKLRQRISDEEAIARKNIESERARILERAAQRKQEIRREGGADVSRKLQEVDKARDEALARLKEGEREMRRTVDELRRRAAAEIERCEKAIAHNAEVLRSRNRAMYEMLFHESFHAFVQNYLFADREIPRWLHEGMASYFERSVVEAGELIHGAPHPDFLALLRSPPEGQKLRPIEEILRAGPELFLVTHRDQANRSTVCYAQSWAIAHYLVRNAPQGRIEQYVKAAAGGADPVVALEDVLGMKIGALEEAVLRHVAALK